jgi:hypothetical protein
MKPWKSKKATMIVFSMVLSFHHALFAKTERKWQTRVIRRVFEPVWYLGSFARREHDRTT